MRSYCVKQKKQTECVPGSERVTKTKNGKSIMKCTCAECGITKTRFVKIRKGGENPLGKALDAAKWAEKITRKVILDKTKEGYCHAFGEKSKNW